MKILFNILLVIFVFSNLAAQTGSSYTRYGIGDLQYTYSARRLAMGQLGAAVSDFENVSTLNPASWHRIFRTRMEFDLSYKGVFISDGALNKYYGKADFNGFTFAVPVSPLYGITAALGLVPYSNVNYDVVQNYESDVTGNYTATLTGDGGLSKVFIGSSYMLPFGTVIGASLDYYFGNIDYTTLLDYESSDLASTEYNRNYRPVGLGTTLGLISSDISPLFNSDFISDFKIGVALNYTGGLTTDSSLVSNSVVGEDTIASGRVQMDLPLRLTTGLSFMMNGKFLVSLDYAFQPWSKFAFNNVKSSFLRDSYKISSGFEYRPIRELGDSFWEQIFWRAGLSYEQTQYIINGEGIDELSVSGGFSMPMSPGNYIDVGLMFGMRGTNNSGLIKENIVRMNVGISLGEIWFIRSDK